MLVLALLIVDVIVIINVIVRIIIIFGVRQVILIVHLELLRSLGVIIDFTYRDFVLAGMLVVSIVIVIVRSGGRLCGKSHPYRQFPRMGIGEAFSMCHGHPRVLLGETEFDDTVSGRNPQKVAYACGCAPTIGRPMRLALPESDQYENQSDDGQANVPELETRFCQQVVGLGFAGQPDAKDSGKQQHENRPRQSWFFTIDAPMGVGT
jgi:hypothetical protein